jgi:two-component system, cell cycle sensor histidine kinase and response regulator CckA
MQIAMQPKPKAILVVDDAVSVLTVVKCMLECADYTVLLASSATAALRIAKDVETAIDLLITDVIMPDMQGPDLAEEIVSLRPELKVLFISGYADSDVVRIKVLNCNLDFLPKPFAPDGLLEMVERMLAMPTPRAMAARFERLE